MGRIKNINLDQNNQENTPKEIVKKLESIEVPLEEKKRKYKPRRTPRISRRISLMRGK